MKIKLFDKDNDQIFAETSCEFVHITLDDGTVFILVDPESGTLALSPDPQSGKSLFIEPVSPGVIYLRAV